MHNVIWADNWESFELVGNSSHINIVDRTLEVNKPSGVSSVYKYYLFPCGEISEVNVFTEAKLIDGTAYIGVDFYSKNNIKMETQQIKIVSRTFVPTSLKAISPKGTVYCRVTFGVWHESTSGHAMYKIPQVYVSKGDGVPSICAASIRFAHETKTFTIEHNYLHSAVRSVEWDSSLKCLNVYFDGNSTWYPNVWVSPLANSFPANYVVIGENWPRSKNRVQVFWKDATNNSIVDLMTVSTNLYVNVLIIR